MPALLTGRVTDDGGAPLALASVAVVRAPVPMPDIAALTDADGRFTLTAPAPGEYEVGVSADGFERTTAEVTVGGDGEAALEIRLRRASPGS
ncbi:carboxypeptidase-like regulatory domain-containing protein [Sinomonas mesophila]|uniref:carboxypeptidase-like regulatory domain-containing protein n=1 Tax=Sinomonas mesophila TaxID=1531955 RepID=UPI0009856B8F|nr:carboxypeptidase-like regulatory domain-containing protein [Sinomonas mesophila]